MRFPGISGRTPRRDGGNPAWKSHSTKRRLPGGKAPGVSPSRNSCPGSWKRSSTRDACPQEVKARHKRRAIELGFSAMDVPLAHGGRAARSVDQVAVWEQLGRVTNALCWCFSEPHSWMFEACSRGPAAAVRPAADDRQAQGMLRHHRERLGIQRRHPDDGPALLRRATGSTARSGTSPAPTTPTSSSCRRSWPTARNAGADALFFVDKDSPGIELVRTPLFSHTFGDHHPTYRFNDVVVAETQRLGTEGDGMQFSHSLVPARAADDRGALLRGGQPADRGGDRLCRPAGTSAASRWPIAR